MQPCYLPWLGHLRLMASVEHYIYLDDVQYSKNGWDNRNRIILPDGRVSWLTVPVARERADICLNEIRIDAHPHWRRKNLGTLQQAYARHEHYSELEDLLRVIEFGKQKNLAELNCDLLDVVADKCGIKAKIWRSSLMNIDGKRSARLENICHELDCDTYLSTPGAKHYLDVDAFGAGQNIKLEILDIEFNEYSQTNAIQFVPQLSFVDAVANVGWAQVTQLIQEPRN